MPAPHTQVAYQSIDPVAASTTVTTSATAHTSVPTRMTRPKLTGTGGGGVRRGFSIDERDGGTARG